MEKFKLAHKLDIRAVQYKGAAPALLDVAAGRVAMIFDFVASSAPYVQSGKVKALMTGCSRRIDMYADIPSAAEAGPEVDVPSWVGIFAPSGTPTEVAELLNKHINRIQSSPDVRGRLAYAGARIPLLKAQEFAEFVRQDRPKWIEIIKAAGVKPE